MIWALLVQGGSAAGSEALATGGAVAVVLGLVEAVKALAHKQRAASGVGVFTEADREALKATASGTASLVRDHAPEGGVQEWKNPGRERERELLSDILETLREIRARQGP